MVEVGVGVGVDGDFRLGSLLHSLRRYSQYYEALPHPDCVLGASSPRLVSEPSLDEGHLWWGVRLSRIETALLE